MNALALHPPTCDARLLLASTVLDSCAYSTWTITVAGH